MLRAVLIKLCLVSKSVGEEERLDAQFLFQAPLCGNAIGLSSARVTAAGVGPEVRPQWLITAALLEQYFSAGVEQKIENARWRVPAPWCSSTLLL